MCRVTVTRASLAHGRYRSIGVGEWWLEVEGLSGGGWLKAERSGESGEVKGKCQMVVVKCGARLIKASIKSS